MLASLRRISALAVVGLTLFTACSVEPTSPSAPGASPATHALLGTVTGTVNNLLTSVEGVQRKVPLASSITVTKTIGVAGGTLSIPQAGVTVTVPSGALSASTVVTMTARAGSLLAYDFAPHGITFAKPLVFTQSLSGTNATILNAPLLKLGYYTDPSLLTALGGLVSELIGANANLLDWTFTSSITHFSGYMVSMGRSSDM